MSKYDRLTPFNDSFGDSIGRGKDNIVAPFRRKPNLVVKWNHDDSNRKKQVERTESFNRILYKRKKYELLKFFLGDFIPESSFVLGHKQDGSNIKTKEYILQKRVPQVIISELNESQKSDPRLIRNMYLLIRKLRNMHNILNQINQPLDEEEKIDGKLDLGGLSKFAEQSDDSQAMDFDFGVVNYNFMDSPNLLVDPKTMSLYCVDFDKGVWSDAKDATLTLAKALTLNNPQSVELLKKRQDVDKVLIRAKPSPVVPV